MLLAQAESAALPEELGPSSPTAFSQLSQVRSLVLFSIRTTDGRFRERPSCWWGIASGSWSEGNGEPVGRGCTVVCTAVAVAVASLVRAPSALSGRPSRSRLVAGNDTF